VTFTWNHVLYRLYGVSGDLLYIGLTKDIRSRFNQHVAKSPWWPDVADCRIEFLPSWEALKAAEVAAIKAERPRYNNRHNSPPIRLTLPFASS
jgi:phosphoribosyl 1,2-cyclic phosphodiesterase